jgi:hypothetical protein
MPPKDQKGSNFIELYKNRGHGTLLVRELPLLPVDFEDQEEDCGQPPPAAGQVLVWNWASPGIRRVVSAGLKTRSPD